MHDKVNILKTLTIRVINLGIQLVYDDISHIVRNGSHNATIWTHVKTGIASSNGILILAMTIVVIVVIIILPLWASSFKRLLYQNVSLLFMLIIYFI